MSEKYIKEADFNVIIKKIPKEELDKTLSVFSGRNGLIEKTSYEDFLISCCVSNIKDLVLKVKDLDADGQPNVFYTIRTKLLKSIIEENKSLDPKNIIITSDGVLTTKQDDKNVTGTPLINNPSWEAPTVKNNDDGIDTTKNLGYKVVQVWWQRIGQYVKVKVFENDVESVLKERYFHSKTSYCTFIVPTCIVDFEELLQLLETLGITNRITPPKLMGELYDLCVKVNEFLLYENITNNTDRIENTKTLKAYNTDKKSNKNSILHKYLTEDKQSSTKKFKDVPKEDLLNLGQSMKISLIGQDKAVDTLENAIQRACIGLKDPKKPIGSFLFAGRSGCGKTYASKILADELIKDRNNLITIDCSEYSSDYEYSKLIGCFVPGTRVLMANKTYKNIEKINVGDGVISHLGYRRKVELVHEYEQDGEMIQFVTNYSGVPVITTKSHEIYCTKVLNCINTKSTESICTPACAKKECPNKLYENYKLDWVPAASLMKGDIVVFPKDKVVLDASGRTEYKLFTKNIKTFKDGVVKRLFWEDEFYLYMQIKDVSTINYKGKVYDLTVEKDTSYVTEVAVHNSSPGYLGYESGGRLTNAIMKHPFSVVVFDEVEKSSTKIHQLLLQILEEGRLTDGKGNTVSFKDTVIILTSNIGVKEIENIKKAIGIGDVGIITEKNKKIAIDQAIKKKFKPEFLNRLDEIVYFNDLTKEDFIKIIDIELNKLNQNLKSNDTEYKNLTLTFNKSVINHIFKNGIDPDYGARPLKRCIEVEVATPLAKKLLKDTIKKDSTVSVTVKKSKPIFTELKKKKKVLNIPEVLDVPVEEIL